MDTSIGNLLEFKSLSKPQKRGVITFIRRHYEGESIRNIINGLHKAIAKDGKLVGIATNLDMIYRKQFYKD